MTSKTVTLSIELEDNIIKALEDIAQYDGICVEELIIRLIKEYLDG
jgi:predicted DNA-binding ribbon-helix-helix protein